MGFLGKLAAWFVAGRAVLKRRKEPPGTRTRTSPGAPTAASSRAAAPRDESRPAPVTSTGGGDRPVPTQRKGGPGPDTPLELDKGDWKQTLRRAMKEFKEDRASFAAAGMAYYFFLSIFPMLIALVGILGLVKADTSGLVETLKQDLPGGAGEALGQAVSRADAPSDAASLVAAVVGIAAALWSASSAFVALQSGLNVAYDVPEDRKFIGKRGVALVLVLATLVLGGVPSPIFSFGDSTILSIVGWALTVVAVSILFSLFYYLGPKRDTPAWQWVSAGGLIGAAIWIVASLLFAWYVGEFNSYEKTYGPIAGVIVLILWLYLSSLAVLLGGEINSELERQAEKKKP